MTNGRAVQRTAVEAVVAMVLALCLGVAATACNDTATPNNGVVKPASTRPVTPLPGGDVLPPGEPTHSATSGDAPKSEPTPPAQPPPAAPAPIQHRPPEDGTIPPPQSPAPAPSQHPPPNASGPVRHTSPLEPLGPVHGPCMTTDHHPCGDSHQGPPRRGPGPSAAQTPDGQNSRVTR